MPIVEKTGSILESSCEALVNPVNCKGISGKGLALEMANAFLWNDLNYKRACKEKELVIGTLCTSRNPTDREAFPKYIINFPTKDDWRDDSTLHMIDLGLTVLWAEINKLEIQSIAIPQLGCGLGNLYWPNVRILIRKKLGSLKDCRVELYTFYGHRPTIPNGKPSPIGDTGKEIDGRENPVGEKDQ